MNQPMVGAIFTPKPVVFEVKPIVGAGYDTSEEPELKKILPTLAPAILIPFLNWELTDRLTTNKTGIKMAIFFCINIALCWRQI